MDKKIGIILQARLSHTRFPNKELVTIGGKKVLVRILDVLRQLNLPIIVAIPNTKPNDFLKEYLQGLHPDVKVFRGFENDVLARTYDAAKKYKLDVIIRVCSDSPFLRAPDIEQMLSKWVTEREHHQPERMIWGMGCYIFSFNQLQEVNLNQVHAEDREHTGFHHMTLTVDYPDDIPRLEKWNRNLNLHLQ